LPRSNRATGTPHIGVFNISEEKGLVSPERARRLLGWDPAFRLPQPR